MIDKNKFNTNEFFEELINNKNIAKDIIIEDSGPFTDIKELNIKRVDTKIYLDVIGNSELANRKIELGKLCKNEEKIVIKDKNTNKRIEIGIQPLMFNSTQTFLSADYVRSVDNKENKENILIEYVSNIHIRGSI